MTRAKCLVLFCMAVSSTLAMEQDRTKRSPESNHLQELHQLFTEFSDNYESAKKAAGGELNLTTEKKFELRLWAKFRDTTTWTKFNEAMQECLSSTCKKYRCEVCINIGLLCPPASADYFNDFIRHVVFYLVDICEDRELAEVVIINGTNGTVQDVYWPLALLEQREKAPCYETQKYDNTPRRQSVKNRLRQRSDSLSRNLKKVRTDTLEHMIYEPEDKELTSSSSDSDFNYGIDKKVYKPRTNVKSAIRDPKKHNDYSVHFADFPGPNEGDSGDGSA